MELIIAYHIGPEASVDSTTEFTLVEHIHALGFDPLPLLSAQLEQALVRGVALSWIPAIVILGNELSEEAEEQLRRVHRSYPLAIQAQAPTIEKALKALPTSLSLWNGSRPNVLCRTVVRTVYAELHVPALSLRTIATELGFSSERIEREFRDWRRGGLWRFVMDCRLEQARRLLATTSLHVAEVGHAVGYWDKSVFSRTFKKATGYSPRDWRRRDAERSPPQASLSSSMKPATLRTRHTASSLGVGRATTLLTTP